MTIVVSIGSRVKQAAGKAQRGIHQLHDYYWFI